ncbi:MAG: Holliday junction branch migration protein RuvA, partial [Thiotrichaceae bacterium]
KLTETEAVNNTTAKPFSLSHSDEAINALLALGYKPVQASQMIAAYENQGLSVEDMIRQALRASLR